MLDLRLWTLLDAILQAASDPAKAARPLRTWLLPLLNRIPCTPILIAFLHSVQTHTPDLLSIGSRALAVIWPLAVPRISIDPLLDAYGAVLDLFTRHFWNKCDDMTRTTVLRLTSLVVSAYRTSLATSGTKKKVRPFTRGWTDIDCSPRSCICILRRSSSIIGCGRQPRMTWI